MKLHVLDPRPSALEVQVANLSKLRKSGCELIGLEVTVPELSAELCVNIDPQHEGGDHKTSCVHSVLGGYPHSAIWHLRPGEIACFTIRPDLDSFAAFIALKWQMSKELVKSDTMERFNLIHYADTFANSGEWRPVKLFSAGYDQPILAPIARCVADWKLSVNERLAHLENWLLTGQDPAGYREAYEKGRQEILEALESGETKVKVMGSIAYVESKLRAATSIGYAYAPVVVAYNPEFPDKNLGTVHKYTVCQYAPGYINLAQMFSYLSENYEPGWGGSPTIGGSPQGQSSSLGQSFICHVAKEFLI